MTQFRWAANLHLESCVPNSVVPCLGCSEGAFSNRIWNLTLSIRNEGRELRVVMVLAGDFLC